MVLGGQTLFGELIQALRQRIIDGNLVTAAVPGKLTQANVVPAYTEQEIVGDVQLPAHEGGDGLRQRRGRLPSLLALQAPGLRAGGAVLRGGRQFPPPPGPVQAENLADVIRALRETDAEIGLAFDGDGDRSHRGDQGRRIIFPDRQLMLFAEDVLSRVPGGEIIYDVKCTRNLAGWIKDRAAANPPCGTPAALVKAKLKETGAPLAGEMSGHVFFKERWYGFDDGLYTGARLLRSSPATPTPTRCSGPAQRHQHPELNIKMNEGRPFALVDKLKAEAKFEGASSILTIDGVRVDTPTASASPSVQHHPGGACCASGRQPGRHRAHPGRLPPRH